MLFSDNGSGRARALAEELGGEAVASAELAERADFVVLAVKPAGLDAVAPELGAASKVVSILAATPLTRLREALPSAEVLRVMPNVAVEVRQGVLCVAGANLGAEVGAKLVLLGHVVEIGEDEFDEATAIMGCAPAYLALAVEALADAGVAAGLDEELARELVVETTAGTAELLRIRHPADVREAGLEALDREGAREAFAAAVAASLERMRG
jgi:pyrroline-5-carboxylate reductase